MKRYKKAHATWIQEEPYFEFVCPHCAVCLYDHDYEGKIESEEHFEGIIKCIICKKEFRLIVDG